MRGADGVLDGIEAHIGEWGVGSVSEIGVKIRFVYPTPCEVKNVRSRARDLHHRLTRHRYVSRNIPVSTDPSIRVERALRCDYARIDGTAKISVIGIFDRLVAGSFPAMHRPSPSEPGRRPDPP